MNARKAAARDALPRLAYVLADVVFYVEANLDDGTPSIRYYTRLSLYILMIIVSPSFSLVTVTRNAKGAAALAEAEAKAASKLADRVANFATRFNFIEFVFFAQTFFIYLTIIEFCVCFSK